ncbi:MAG: HAD family hydrolase [Erysipelotrichaceae bacterium]
MIKAIIFDYDGTLSNRTTSAYNAIKHIITSNSKKVLSKIELEAIVQDCLTWDQFGAFNRKFLFDNLRNKYDIDINVSDEATYWYEHFCGFQVLYPKSIEVIERLQKEYKLAIITNGQSSTQKKKIENVGLNNYISNIYVGGDFEHQKPHSQIYLQCCEDLGVDPSECLFVGDTFSTDILGAYRLNMKCVFLINDRNRPMEFDEIYRIYNIEELCQVIDGINQPA